MVSGVILKPSLKLILKLYKYYKQFWMQRMDGANLDII
jgi:hypothetical protein